MAPTTRRSTKAKRNRNQRRGMPDTLEAYGRDAWSLAKRTAAGLNEIRKLINIETKFLDFNVTLNPTQSGTGDYWSSIVQGLDVSNRVGDSLKLQSIDLAYGVNIGTGDCYVRTILVRDMENGGGTPTGAEVLQVAGTAKCIFSPYNYANKTRFSVLYDETTVLTALSETRASYKVHIPIDKHVKYRGTTASVTSAAEGSIFFLTFTDLTTGQPSIPAYYRCTFTDD